MREIVHIQAGQCGNQIGAKVGYSFVFHTANFERGHSGRHFVTPASRHDSKNETIDDCFLY